MSEGIDFEQLGTIIVSFDDKTYTADPTQNGPVALLLPQTPSPLRREPGEASQLSLRTPRRKAPNRTKAQAALREYQNPTVLRVDYPLAA